jgi:hypothetical protein
MIDCVFRPPEGPSRFDFDPRQMAGVPAFAVYDAGRQLSAMVADGMPIAKILKEHPTLEAEDIGPLDRGQAGLWLRGPASLAAPRRRRTRA